MRSKIEEEAAAVPKRRGMSSIIGTALVDDWTNAIILEPVGRAKTGHTRTNNSYIVHLKPLSGIDVSGSRQPGASRDARPSPPKPALASDASVQARDHRLNAA